MTIIEAIKQLQKVLGVTADGVFGPVTEKALRLAIQPKVVVSGDTPWYDWFMERMGWTEFNHDKELSKGWKLVGLPGYKSVIGADHAWCGMSLATALNEYGYKIPSGAAGARNWDKYGTDIDWKKTGIPRAAVVTIKHPGGGRHVAIASRDHAPGEGVLSTLGGNQGNSINITTWTIKSGREQIIHVGWPIKSK